MKAAQRSAFAEFVQGRIDRTLAQMAENDLYDNRTLAVPWERVDALTQNPRKEWPSSLMTALTEADTAAAGFEHLGELEQAFKFYRLGTYLWPHEMPDFGEPAVDLMTRDALSLNQLPTAVCNDRIGLDGKARQLYRWAAEHNVVPQEERDAYNLPSLVWERLPWRAYCLACLEQWDQALSVAEEAAEYVEQDPKASLQSPDSPLKILSVVLALARYQTDPTDEHRQHAIEMLQPQTVASRSHPDHLHALFYLFNLRARHPELARPSEGETPPGERARQGYETCIAWMAEGGLRLDGTAESLKTLDEHLAPMWRGLDERQRKTALFLWGSYLGEVVRRELAGGQWRFPGKDLLGWALKWEMGEAEMALHPFQHVWERSRGENQQSLFDLWQAAEDTYIELGLAARFAD